MTETERRPGGPCAHTKGGETVKRIAGFILALAMLLGGLTALAEGTVRRGSWLPRPTVIIQSLTE